ncbi:hypothetical protein LTR53_014679 [Teratosphaeriaceae sp. CCFEE 6253]|nr:hypothetical protein LTR53_014679 [Teratosphaeriaceae sp. CCFEE 6253]
MDADKLYQPLGAGTRQIRILILRESGYLDDPLVCDLEHMILTDPSHTEYETISYCWGDESLRSTVQIQSRLIDVPASSAQSLRRMRLPDKSRVLWIDALCINQKDLAEKSAQVAIMGEIYARGKGNLIYLGEETPDSAGVPDTLAEVHLVDGCAIGGCYSYDIYGEGRGGAIPHYCYAALEDLYGRPWFGPPQPLVDRTGSYPAAAEHSRTRFAQSPVPQGPVRQPRAYSGQAAAGEQSHHPCRPSEPHCTTRGPRSPQLHGCFVASWFDLPPLLRPDYGKSVRDVYRDAARYMLEDAGEHFAALAAISHELPPTVSPTAMPSWVPNWPDMGEWGGNGQSEASLIGYEAHGGTAVQVEALRPEEPDVLEVRGIVIDQLGSVHIAIRSEDFSVGSDGHVLVELIVGVIDHIDDGLLRAEGEDDALDSWATSWDDIVDFLCAGSDKDSGQLGRVAMTSEVIHYLSYMAAYKRQPMAPRELPEDASVQLQRAAHFLVEMRRWVGCQLFFTESGRMGMCRDLLRQDDVLALSYGAEGPCFLRPCGDYHQYICGAYVHGVMRGEAMRQHESEGKPGTSFRLC